MQSLQLRKSRDELVKLFGIARVGNDVQFDFPGIYPDGVAPVVRQDDGGLRTLSIMRWLPATPQSGNEARHQRTEHQKPLLAQLAEAAAVPMFGASDLVL